MSAVATAIVGGSLVSGYLGSRAADKAGKGQTEASAAAIAEERRQFDLNRADLTPYREAGTEAVGRLRDLLGLAPAATDDQRRGIYDGLVAKYEADHLARYGVGTNNPKADVAEHQRILDGLRRQAESQAMQINPGGSGGMTPEQVMQLDPGYQFGLDQGNKAIMNASRASGMSQSPSTVKGLMRYGQDYASQRFGDIYNRFAGLAGTGQSATMGGAQLGNQSTGRIGDLMTGAANARGAAGIAGANAWGGTAQNIGNYYAQNAWMNRMFPQGGTTPSSKGYGVY